MTATQQSPADRRRRAYQQRCAANIPRYGEVKGRAYALTHWWLSELRQMPETRRVAEINRLEALVSALNEGRQP